MKNAVPVETEQPDAPPAGEASMVRINLRVENMQVDEKQCLIGRTRT